MFLHRRLTLDPYPQTLLKFKPHHYTLLVNFYRRIMHLDSNPNDSFRVASSLINKIGNVKECYRVFSSRLHPDDSYSWRKLCILELDLEYGVNARYSDSAADLYSDFELWPKAGCMVGGGALVTPPATPSKGRLMSYPSCGKRKRDEEDTTSVRKKVEKAGAITRVDMKTSRDSGRQAKKLSREQRLNALHSSRACVAVGATVDRPILIEEIPRPIEQSRARRHTSITIADFSQSVIDIVSPSPKTSTPTRSKTTKQRVIRKWELLLPTNDQVMEDQWDGYDKIRKHLEHNSLNGNKHVVIGSTALSLSPEKLLSKTRRRIQDCAQTLAIDDFAEEKSSLLAGSWYPVCSLRRIKSNPLPGGKGYEYCKRIVVASRLYSPFATGKFVDLQYVYVEDAASRGGGSSAGRTTTRFLTWVNCAAGFARHAMRNPEETIFDTTPNDEGEEDEDTMECFKLFDWQTGKNKDKQYYLGDAEVEFLKTHLFPHTNHISHLKQIKLLLICAGLGSFEDENAWETWQDLQYAYDGCSGQDKDDFGIYGGSDLQSERGNLRITEEENEAYERFGLEVGDVVGEEFYEKGVSGLLHGMKMEF